MAVISTCVLYTKANMKLLYCLITLSCLGLHFHIFCHINNLCFSEFDFNIEKWLEWNVLTLFLLINIRFSTREKLVSQQDYRQK